MRLIGTPSPRTRLEAARETARRAAASLDGLLQKACATRCSDLHLLPVGDRVVVTARIAGRLVKWDSLPGEYLPPVVSRIRVLAGLDILERNASQEGAIEGAALGEASGYSIRASMMPSVSGFSVNLRFHWPEQACSLAGLGMGRSVREPYLGTLADAGAFVLIAGPAGSGKTTTLYATLREMSSLGLSVACIEDPPEQELPGVLQVPVSKGQGFGFTDAARAALRHDVDVLGVGEIRDQSSARAAIWACTSGKTVVSTIHSRDAASAIFRLAELAGSLGLIGSALSGVLSQELVSFPCPDCPGPRADASCARCWGSGLAGRTGAYRLLTLDHDLKRALCREIPESAFRELLGEDAQVTCACPA